MHKVRSQRGSVLTEFALYFPLLLAVIAATISVGVVLRQRNLLIDGLRHAGRTMSIVSANSGGAEACPLVTYLNESCTGLGPPPPGSQGIVERAAWWDACANSTDRGNAAVSAVSLPMITEGGQHYYFVDLSVQPISPKKNIFSFGRLIPQLVPTMDIAFPLLRGGTGCQ